MSSDRSATYNNAGCRMMAIGNQRVALDLFQASLESKLAYERQGVRTMGTGGPMNDENVVEMDIGGELVGQAPEDFLDFQPQRCVTPEIPACLHTAGLSRLPRPPGGAALLPPVCFHATGVSRLPGLSGGAALLPPVCFHATGVSRLPRPSGGVALLTPSR